MANSTNTHLTAAKDLAKNPFEGMSLAKMKAKWGTMSPAQRKANEKNFINAATKAPTKAKPAASNNRKAAPTSKPKPKAKKPTNTTKKAQSTSDAMKRDYNKSRSKTIAEAMAKAAKGKKLTDAQSTKGLTDAEDYSTAKRFQKRYR